MKRTSLDDHRAYRRDKAKDLIEVAKMERAQSIIQQLWDLHRACPGDIDRLHFSFSLVWNWIDHLPSPVSDYGLRNLRTLFGSKYYDQGRVRLMKIPNVWLERWLPDID
jgi:hypothetical protein